MWLLDNMLSNMKVVVMFKEHQNRIKHFEFSPDGTRMISGGADNRIVVYDCVTGTVTSVTDSVSYGVDLLRFCHDTSLALHTSPYDQSYLIRNFSLSDGRLIHDFQGHERKIVSLSLSPVQNFFVSGSQDKTMKIWDIRAPNCTLTINFDGTPLAAFDPSGLELAVSKDSDTLMLYDIRGLSRGPFNASIFAPRPHCDWTDLKFNPKGQSVLVSTSGSVTSLIDVYNGEVVHTFKGYPNPERIPMEASFSPDGQYICCGSTDGRIYVYNAVLGHTVCVLQGFHTGPVQCVKFNPRELTMASSCTDMSFWAPWYPIFESGNSVANHGNRVGQPADLNNCISKMMYLRI